MLQGGPEKEETVTSVGAGSEVEEDRDVREEETEGPGDWREQILSGFFGWGLFFPGEAAWGRSPLVWRVGVPL